MRKNVNYVVYSNSTSLRSIAIYILKISIENIRFHHFCYKSAQITVINSVSKSLQWQLQNLWLSQLLDGPAIQ